MPIRFAQRSDIPDLVEGGSRMHQLTRFRHQPYNAQKVAQAFANLINAGSQSKYVFLVAEDSKGKVVGALIGVLEQQIFTDGLTASVMHFDVLPESRMGGYGLRLLRAFEQWAKNRKVVEINFGINSLEDEDALERISKFAIKLGYRLTGQNYVFETTKKSTN